jgi:hypothetical protein
MGVKKEAATLEHTGTEYAKARTPGIKSTYRPREAWRSAANCGEVGVWTGLEGSGALNLPPTGCRRPYLSLRGRMEALDTVSLDEGGGWRPASF